MMRWNSRGILKRDRSRLREVFYPEGRSIIARAETEFYLALGQFLNYRVALKSKNSDRTLYLAIPLEIYRDFFLEEFTQLSLQEHQVKLLVFDPKSEAIATWID